MRTACYVLCNDHYITKKQHMYIYKNKYFFGKQGVIGVNGDKSTLFYVYGQQ